MSLTDNRSEVLYKLGRPQEVEDEPPTEGGEAKSAFDRFARIYHVDGPAGDTNAMPADKELDDFPGWHWTRKTDGHAYTAIHFTKAGNVRSILSYDQHANLDAWGPLAGIRDGDSEERILWLGKPTSSRIEGVTKTIEFDDIGVRFTLIKDKAYLAELRHSKGGELAIVKRFLYTRLP